MAPEKKHGKPISFVRLAEAHKQTTNITGIIRRNRRFFEQFLARSRPVAAKARASAEARAQQKEMALVCNAIRKTLLALDGKTTELPTPDESIALKIFVSNIGLNRFLASVRDGEGAPDGTSDQRVQSDKRIQRKW